MKKFNLLNFIVSLAVGAVLAALVFFLGQSRGYSVLRSLSDCFFVPAVALIGVSGIIAARNDGFFDTLLFSVKYTIFNHFPAAKNKDEKFVEYKERKASERKSALNMLLAGAVYLVLSLVFLAIYLNEPK